MLNSKIHYVYLTTNLINGKQYIGDHTINPDLKKYYLGSGKLIKKAIKKYGTQNFFKEILEWFSTKEEASNKEEKYIKLYKTHISQGGYNISRIGGKIINVIHSKNSIQKMSTSHKNMSEKTKQKMRKPKSKQHRENMRKPRSEEHKRNMSLSNIGELNPFYGKKHSEETRKKISKSTSKEKHYNWGKKLLKETKQKISETEKRTKSKITINDTA